MINEVLIMDFSSVEDTIGKIQGVKHIKIVADEDVMQEIHIIANELRTPKQIVRDIESTLIAIYNYKVDRKIISIAQIDDGTLRKVGRVIYNGMTINSSESSFQCEVKLTFDNQEYTAAIKGINTKNNRCKVVAGATLSTVEKIIGQGIYFDIDDVIISKSGSTEYVNVIITMLKNTIEKKLIGSAIIKSDVKEAIAKASLDGINRVIGAR